MLVLFLYLLWSLSYLLILVLFNLFFLKKILNKKSNLVNFLLILFYNKNLSFYKNDISILEAKKLNNIRFENYSVLYVIHQKINNIFLSNKKNKISFKNNYNLYKYLNNNNLNLNIKSNLNISNTVLYSVSQNIFKTYLNKNEFNYFLLALFNIFKNSLSNKNLIITKVNYERLNSSNLNQTNNLSKFELNLINLKKNLMNYSNYISKLNNLSIYNVSINSSFLNNISNTFKINFSASNIVKYLSDLTVSKSTILFLRKNKVFNKSRYSRNRQTYRTGAYWCLYINIIAVVAFYFWFYNFTMNFGYVWWLLYSFILSFFLFKAIKFNFYNPKTVMLEFINSFKWLYLIIISLIKQILNLINLNLNILNLNYLIINYFKNKKNSTLLNKVLISVNNINNYLFNKIC